MKKRITFDFETRSKSPLKLEGPYKYSLDPSSQPTCLGIKKHGESRIYFFRFEAINLPWKQLQKKYPDFCDMWSEWILDGYEFSAHNAFFERCIYENILVARLGWPMIPARQYRCTAAKAAACALPRKLEGAGEAMRLRIQKDKRGYVAMMKTCKPTRQWNDYWKAKKQLSEGRRIQKKRAERAAGPPPPMFLEYAEAPDVWETLYTYCKFDVKSEEELDDSIPDLIPSEQEIWHLNQKLNWRGLRVDMPTIKKVSAIMETESIVLKEELDTVTMGLIKKPGAIKSILEFLAIDDVILPNLRAKTIEDVLKNRDDLDSDMRRLLEIRQALSKSSTKKYQSFLNRVNDDERVRDILMYHGASTGRDTGTGIMPHNFPRGLLNVDKANPYSHVENVIKCDKETLQLLYGDNLSILFSAILRNMIIPSPGKKFFVADFSKIEVAVCWWLANNWAGLKVLNSGKDPYIYQAAENLGKTYEEIETAVKNEEPWAMDARQLGKAQILGCQFGMGWMKFQSTAWDQYRLKLNDKQSKGAVFSYREANSAVPELWESYELAAVAAIETQKTVTAGKCKFIYKRDPKAKTQFLWVELPSGRRLAYADPQISWRVREYQVKEPVVDRKGRPVMGDDGEPLTKFKTVQTQPQKTIEFWAVNTKTKKWSIERSWGGTLCENITQAVARDLMMPAMVRLEKNGYEAQLMVHDEGISQKANGTVEEFVKILCERPAWAKGLPIEAKGWEGLRYRK